MRGFTFLNVPRNGVCYTESTRKDFAVMKAGIHPAYEEINVICACGNTFRTRSTNKGDIRVEICSNCHPFFTGRQKLVDTEGRVDRFQKKIQKSKDLKETRSKKQPVAAK
jgi:large subunit ribosomal protein L31